MLSLIMCGPFRGIQRLCVGYSAVFNVYVWAIPWCSTFMCGPFRGVQPLFVGHSVVFNISSTHEVL